MHNLGIDIPAWLSTDYRTAMRLAGRTHGLREQFGSAALFGYPSSSTARVGIVALITMVLVWGIRESAGFNAVMS